MENNNKNNASRILVLRPSAGSAYGFGWERMKTYFLDLFLITLIMGFVLIPLGMISSLDGHETAGGILLRIFGLAYWLLLFAPIDYGAALMFLKAARGEKFEVKEMFSTFENYLNVVLAKLLVTSIIAFGIILLVVPGIIFACKLAFVKYLVVEKRMDPVDAVKESWKMTTGYTGEIFLMGLAAAGIAVAGLICLGVGIIPAVMWIRTSFASMYFAVTKNTTETRRVEA
jgi:uncharacterized membrane protein